MNAETRAKYREMWSIQINSCAIKNVQGVIGLRHIVEPFIAVKPEHLKELLEAEAERDRYLALLQEIATVKDHKEETAIGITVYHVTLGSIQRHVRQQLEKWGVKIDD